LDRTIVSDKENIKNFEALGYTVLVIWECETKKNTVAGSLLRDSTKKR
jgi:G:T-mismatch repair DNA endonuclease (very short patch repair protein)